LAKVFQLNKSEDFEIVAKNIFDLLEFDNFHLIKYLNVFYEKESNQVYAIIRCFQVCNFLKIQKKKRSKHQIFYIFIVFLKNLKT
jgi:hypothetical protein